MAEKIIKSVNVERCIQLARLDSYAAIADAANEERAALHEAVYALESLVGELGGARFLERNVLGGTRASIALAALREPRDAEL